MNTFEFGLRNLQRNYRRSLVSVLSIAFGFAALVLFSGYAKTVYRGLQDQAIYGELLGHLTVTKNISSAEGHFHSEKILFTPAEIAKIIGLVRDYKPEIMIAPRLHLKGMLSNGRASSIFIAEALDPQDMKYLRGPRSGMSGMLEEGNPAGVTVSRGLAEMLGLREGDTAAVLSTTLNGQTNALDVVISDIFSTGNTATEDKFMFFPLKHAQMLTDTLEMADRLTLLQAQGQPSAEDISQLSQLFAQAGMDLQIHTWQELSSFYRQVRSMFDMIFGFLLTIVLVIVVMSVSSAMNMSVVERTREIGTLRAIGMKQRGITQLFAMEAALLVLLGCASGLILSIAVRYGVNAADISYQPPNSSGYVPLLIGIAPGRTAIAAILLGMLGVISAFFPARRAARQPVVDSLAH